MRICLIAPGEIEIPPKGWGALETVVSNQYTSLRALGHDVGIINTKNPNDVMKALSDMKPEVVHLHYGSHYQLMPYLNVRKIVTCHDGSYKNSIAFHEQIARKFLYDCEFFCLTTIEQEMLLKIGFAPSKVRILPNGVNFSAFRKSNADMARFKSNTICVGKIDSRKRQSALQKMNLGIAFVGENASPDFQTDAAQYLGTWTREQVYENLTDFPNLILLSESELQPLVCLEAMAAGLGLVISEACTQNLDTSRPFITVIPQDKLDDANFIGNKIKENAEYSLRHREDIWAYAASFNWMAIAQKYNSYLYE